MMAWKSTAEICPVFPQYFRGEFQCWLSGNSLDPPVKGIRFESSPVHCLSGGDLAALPTCNDCVEIIR